MGIDLVIILLLVAFILGLIVGVILYKTYLHAVIVVLTISLG